MIDADPVDLGEQALEPRVEEAEHGARTGATRHALDVATRVEHRVSPRLARGGRAARRRAHPVAPEEELGMAPFVDRREPDRKITEEMEPDRPRCHGEAAPVRVR